MKEPGEFMFDPDQSRRVKATEAILNALKTLGIEEREGAAIAIRLVDNCRLIASMDRAEGR